MLLFIRIETVSLSGRVLAWVFDALRLVAGLVRNSSSKLCFPSSQMGEHDPAAFKMLSFDGDKLLCGRSWKVSNGRRRAATWFWGSVCVFEKITGSLLERSRAKDEKSIKTARSSVTTPAKLPLSPSVLSRLFRFLEPRVSERSTLISKIF